MTTEVHCLAPLDHRFTGDFARADLEIYSVNTFRPSYDAWVFLNDPDVTADNAAPDRPSFAGAFAVFGHEDCWGDPGHCCVPEETRRFDHRRSHHLTRAFKRARVTRALNHVIETGEPVAVTIVARTREAWERDDGERLFEYDGMQVVTFR
ncbi:hypothetical protein HN371_27615 [Candidatus Poribacteria bacterium]|jgi:tyrosinase|nr:hypothetical protein [Candidatus Poribacteria bacterium]MBT5534167.1 hypothetical protein [Candidatus Poribacteria bacterium]MBT5711227.1 hypothetical protein [Candidatus Poribacteria bacterium]MBT7096182.1 hypothetical protein [Candidatus Poribacteria bacterium]MBT7807947.1 hypothetical protein [Candidatus Poribacteria bacterium]